MNKPLLNSDLHSHHGWLRVFAFFHLNLAFSSIEEERRDDVIARCYWPLLRLAEKHPHIGIEITGYTLEEIAKRDPAWIAEVRRLIGEDKIEIIGSGYSQMIGPLVPARVTQENLRIGDAVYHEILGVKPSIALVNEQAFSAGLVGHYLDAGYRALLMDWDNPSASHPSWNPEIQYLPQYAKGIDDEKIALLWTNTAAFQQMQRFAYDDISLESYLRFVHSRRALNTRVLCLYASDAEIFDFRPGRFHTENKLPDHSEWDRLSDALTAVRAEQGVSLVGPSHALRLIDRDGGGNILELGTATCPVPVKKQRKYNLARWAVSGRDNTAINAACERIYQGMMAGHAANPDWKLLCYLWASDFRTHLTESRWNKYRVLLSETEEKWSRKSYPATAVPSTSPVTERYINIETPFMTVRLDRRRGLALDRVLFAGDARAVIGGIPHGYFDDIGLQADWYTGNCVFEEAGEHKVTDLEWCEARVDKLADGSSIAHARTDTRKGIITKQMHFSASERRIDFDVTFDWEEWGKGILRLGHLTLLPAAFNASELTWATCNGGKAERYSLDGQPVEHGAPVSYLVSSACGFGMTDGWFDVGDNRTRLRVEVDRSEAALLGLLTYRNAKHVGRPGSMFCQFQLSALELDDTRNPSVYRAGPRRFRFSIRENCPNFARLEEHTHFD